MFVVHCKIRINLNLHCVTLDKCKVISLLGFLHTYNSNLRPLTKKKCLPSYLFLFCYFI